MSDKGFSKKMLDISLSRTLRDSALSETRSDKELSILVNESWHSNPESLFPKGLNVRENEPMKRHTTFNVGGPADYFATPATEDELRELIEIAHNGGLPCTIMGGGSNFLVRDKGIRGIVISLSRLQQDFHISPSPGGELILKKTCDEALSFTSADGIDKKSAYPSNIQGKTEETPAYRVTVSAGMQLSALCKKCMALGLGDLSFAAGIPGTVGGAIRMNAGTGLGTISRHLHTIDILDCDGQFKTLSKSELLFSHRTLQLRNEHEITYPFSPSPFMERGMGGEVSGQVISDRFLNEQHTKHKTDHIFSNKDYRKPVLAFPVILKASFLLTKEDPEKIKASWQHLMDRRKTSQPTGVASAGCFFKNPDNGMPAGWLIDKAGLKKRQVGDAMVSDLHANFIVNRGNARAKDILDLQDIVRKTVKTKFGITLVPEVMITGE